MLWPRWVVCVAVDLLQSRCFKHTCMSHQHGTAQHVFGSHTSAALQSLHTHSVTATFCGCWQSCLHAQELRRLLHDLRSSCHHAVQQLLSDFLASTDWGPLCQRLLPLLPDSGLLHVAHTLADDLHTARQGQQQAHSSRSSSSKDSLLSCWCRKQCSVGAQLAAAAGATVWRPRALQEQVLAALQAAATTPAVQLPCVSEPLLLLLGCLQFAKQGIADAVRVRGAGPRRFFLCWAGSEVHFHIPANLLRAPSLLRPS